MASQLSTCYLDVCDSSSDRQMCLSGKAIIQQEEERTTDREREREGEREGGMERRERESGGRGMTTN